MLNNKFGFSPLLKAPLSIFSYVPKIKYYQDNKNEWRWEVKADNNKIIGASTEGYKNEKDCRENLKQLVEMAKPFA